MVKVLELKYLYNNVYKPTLNKGELVNPAYLKCENTRSIIYKDIKIPCNKLQLEYIINNGGVEEVYEVFNEKDLKLNKFSVPVIEEINDEIIDGNLTFKRIFTNVNKKKLIDILGKQILPSIFIYENKLFDFHMNELKNKFNGISNIYIENIGNYIIDNPLNLINDNIPICFEINKNIINNLSNELKEFLNLGD